MHILGLLPGQELYRYTDGTLKIHWNYDILKRAHKLHYLKNFNCLQLSSLAGYLRSQMDATEDATMKQDLQRRIQAISSEINKRYTKVNDDKNTWKEREKPTEPTTIPPTTAEPELGLNKLTQTHCTYSSRATRSWWHSVGWIVNNLRTIMQKHDPFHQNILFFWPVSEPWEEKSLD